MRRQSWSAAVCLSAGLLLPAALPARAGSDPALTAFALAQFGAPPAVPSGALPDAARRAVDAFVAHSLDPAADVDADAAVLQAVADTADPRLVWVIADVMRFTWRSRYFSALADTGRALLGIAYGSISVREELLDHLIAWRVPAYPGYLAHKRAVFTRYVDGWDALFVEGDIAWERVSWGGVNIDARPFGDRDTACACIPAVDNPAVSRASEATWLRDTDIVFGVSVNGTHRAYPRRIMEVREMVNDTLGGRALGIPYCSLCGAAQAYYTDGMPPGVARPVLRTSGLLLRSNKVMYDLNTDSLFDTFRGRAVTGPLAAAGVVLTPVSVVTTEWGAWKAAHPDTTVLVEALALGRDYDLRNTRDARGPIFPVGDIDPRLPVHEDVVGAIAPDGTPVAFQRTAAVLALKRGETVELAGVRLVREAGGLRATDVDGTDLGSHPAYWFAWSQFHPGTALWTP